ncbi:MAG TPA: hypothetical protein VJI97_04845 [Candidatus Nanoarchaeia archaeon]|nr:hypothetical protein [Candidatus Nanoarchaeia archaeon]
MFGKPILTADGQVLENKNGREVGCIVDVVIADGKFFDNVPVEIKFESPRLWNELSQMEIKGTKIKIIIKH